jgi:hypothetical protein
MSFPVGTVDFLITFDNAGLGFRNAMRDALQQAFPGGLGGGLTDADRDRLRRIEVEVSQKYAVRGMSASYAEFVSESRKAENWMRNPENLQYLVESVMKMTPEALKSLYGIEPDDPNKQLKITQQLYGLTTDLVRQFQDMRSSQPLWEKDKEKLSGALAWIDSVMAGKNIAMPMGLAEQAIRPEQTAVGETIFEILQRAGISYVGRGAESIHEGKAKSFSRLKLPTGTTLGGAGEGEEPLITGLTELTAALREAFQAQGMAGGDINELIENVIGRADVGENAEIVRTAIQRILERYRFAPETLIPMREFEAMFQEEATQYLRGIEWGGRAWTQLFWNRPGGRAGFRAEMGQRGVEPPTGEQGGVAGIPDLIAFVHDAEAQLRVQTEFTRSQGVPPVIFNAAKRVSDQIETSESFIMLGEFKKSLNSLFQTYGLGTQLLAHLGMAAPGQQKILPRVRPLGQPMTTQEEEDRRVQIEMARQMLLNGQLLNSMNDDQFPDMMTMIEALLELLQEGRDNPSGGSGNV